MRVANGKRCLERVAVGNIGNRSAGGIWSNRGGQSMTPTASYAEIISDGELTGQGVVKGCS